MGWMSWTAFYCEMDCVKHPKGCINEILYMEMADELGKESIFLYFERKIFLFLQRNILVFENIDYLLG